jgi:tetratricopeptide (TPR) repeat protein
VGWLWFLGTLVPVIGFMQLGGQARADRYTYIPHIGLLIAIVWSADALMERWRVANSVRRLVAVGCVGLLTVDTIIQVGYWKDAESIWVRTIEVTDRNDFAHSTLGQYCLRKYYATHKSEYLERALKHAREAEQLRPRWIDYEHQLGVMLLHKGKPEEACQHFRLGLQSHPDSPDVWRDLGGAEFALGNDAAARDALLHAKALQPGDPVTRVTLGNVYWKLGEREAAKAEWEAALKLDSMLIDAQLGLGRYNRK